MLILYALDYVYLGSALRHLILILESPDEMSAISATHRKQVCEELPMVRQHCAKIELKISCLTVTHWIEEFEKDQPVTFFESRLAIQEIERVVANEIGGIIFLYPEKNRSDEFLRMYEEASVLILKPWPGALSELEKSRLCYVYGQDTASVFHSMRAAEKVLVTMAKSLEVSIGRDQWHTIIERIEKSIKEFDKLPRGDERDQKTEFYSDAAMQLRFIKNAWRNHVMHGRMSYSEKDAREIWWHVKRTIEKATQQLEEDLDA